MAEKIIYEVGLEGTSAVVGGINAIQNALSNISAEGVAGINANFENAAKEADELIEKINGIAKAVKSVNGIFSSGKGGRRNKSNWIGNVSDAVGKWNQSWEKQFKTHWVVDDEGNRKRIYDEGWGAPSNFMADFARARNRMSNDWGTLRQRARSMLMQSFGYTPLLGWDTGAGFTTGEIGATSMKDNLAARDSIAKIHREYFRDLKSRFYAPTVWQGGSPAVVNSTGTALATLNNKYGIVNTGKVTDPGYIDAEWNYVGAGSMSGTRAAMIEDRSGGASGSTSKAKLVASLLGLLGKLNLWATAIQAALRGMKFFISAIKKFVNGLAELGHALASTSWRQLREAFAYGTSVNSLARHERAMASIGGDAASASALLGRWSRERSMLAFGGNGGSMMEAARLYGINIMGSGEHGFATNDEFMRNVIAVMSRSTPETRNAIAGTLGLTPYQTWAMSHGQKYYDSLGRKSLADIALGDAGSEWDKQNSAGNARRFEGAWGEFMVSVKELANTLGDIILPALTVFIDFLEGVMEIVNYILKPLSWFVSALSNLLSSRWWSEMLNIEDTPSANAMNAQALVTTRNGQQIAIDIGTMNFDSSKLPEGVSSEQMAHEFAKQMFDKIGDLIINDRR